MKSKGAPGIQFGGKGTKVHIDVLKLRTKCARCGQIGHWARECVNEPDARGKRASEASNPGAAKSGFFEVGEAEGTHFEVTLGTFFKKPVVKVELENPDSDSYLETDSQLGLVDTAAQGGLIGRSRLQELEEALGRKGMKVKWLNKKAQARGVGGDAHVCGVVQIPVGIAGVNGLIETTVVEEKVPFLLSIKFLREVDAIVDLVRSRLELKRFGQGCRLWSMQTGHIGVDVMNFPKGGWKMPSEAVSQFCDKDFSFWSTAAVSSLIFMSCSDQPRDPRELRLRHGPFESYQADAGRTPSAKRKKSTVSRKSCQKLASADGEGCRSDGVCQGTSTARSLARRWIKAWLVVAVSSCAGPTNFGQFLAAGMPKEGSVDQGADLCGVDQEWQLPGNPQVPTSTDDDAASVPSPAAVLGGCWKPEPTRSVVQGVSLSVAGGSNSDEPNSEESCSDSDQRKGLQPVAQDLSQHGSTTCQEQEGGDGEGVLGSSSSTSQRASTDPAPKTPVCKCQKPATQLIVKKEGPTQGRLFWKCSQRLCDFFEWDQEETNRLQRRALQELEDAELKKIEEQEKLEREHLIHLTMEAAEKRHQEILMEEQEKHRVEMEQVQNQMFWLSAIVGEEKMHELFSNPELQQMTMEKAMQLKEQVMNQMAAEENDP